MTNVEFEAKISDDESVEYLDSVFQEWRGENEDNKKSRKEFLDWMRDSLPLWAAKFRVEIHTS